MTIYFAIVCLVYGTFCLFTRVPASASVAFGVIGAVLALSTLIKDKPRG